jgi:sugar phosphate isomerase/epimerase
LIEKAIMTAFDRRSFLSSVVGLAAGGLAPVLSRRSFSYATTLNASRNKMRFGLVTYMWGSALELPELLSTCEKAGALGVELRTQHAHGVEPNLSDEQRREVKQRFADSPVKLVGLGSNEDFHDVDSASLKASIEQAKNFIKLSHDVGGSGVKVKPNDLPDGVPRERTIEQIGRALNELGSYAADYDQQVRLEVHGQCAPLPTIASIMKVADHPNVAVCWNSNPQDLEGKGLESNFRLVEKRLGATTHVRELDRDRYPYRKLFELLKAIHYNGWILIEASDKPADLVAALVRQRESFQRLSGQ